MPLWAAFVGQSYRARSQVIAADTAINVYLETTENAADPKQATFYGTPGLRLLLALQGSSCRGAFQQDGRSWACIGGYVHEFNLAAGTSTLIGTVPNDGSVVTFASNGEGGSQLAICASGGLYVFDLVTSVFAGPVSLPGGFVPVEVGFIDGYGLLLERDSPKIWFTALEDFTSVSGLDFFARSETSDNFVGFLVLNNRIWCFGSQTSEIFYNTGDSDNPFAPYPGTLMQEGAVGYASMAISGEAAVWLAQDNQGRNRVVTAGTPEQIGVISTPAISFALAQMPTLDDIEVLAYEQEGHPFVCFTSPSTGLTFSYDFRSQGWHQRQALDEPSGDYVRWNARGTCVSGQTVVVGDYASGNLYALDLDTFTDNGNTILRERTAPYLGTDNQKLFLDQFELGMQPGVGLVSGQGVDPTLTLEASWDGAQTWGPPVEAPLGPMGHYEERAVWRQLGSGIQAKLVLRVRQSDPVRCVWGPGAWIRATPGTGQL